MAGNKYISKLRSMERAVTPGEVNPFLDVLRTPSPSVNWALANPGHGLPYGCGMILYGPPKGGKSIICNALIGQLHKDDPDAFAIYYNTEFRAEIQSNRSQLKIWGIDEDRFQAFNTNAPEYIFDHIEKDLKALIQDGCKIKLIIIDSLTNIAGRRMLNADTVNQQLIGDQAATIKDGLLRIMPVIRDHKIALVATSHIRAELDPKEQMRGNNVKMAAAWATKHTFEYFCYVEPNLSKDGKITLAGEELVDKEIIDFMGNAQKNAHKIRFKVKESSIGPAGRTAEFTLDYKRGIINQYEEIFTLAKNLGIIERPNLQTYKYKDLQWRGLINCLIAIRDNPELQSQLLAEIVKKDRELPG